MSHLNKMIRRLVADTGLKIIFSGMAKPGCVTAEILSPVKPNRRDTAAAATADSAENALALAAVDGLRSIHYRVQRGFVSLEAGSSEEEE